MRNVPRARSIVIRNNSFVPSDLRTNINSDPQVIGFQSREINRNRRLVNRFLQNSGEKIPDVPESKSMRLNNPESPDLAGPKPLRVPLC
jgi:hypothetical protein